jgi:hypothetical protein
MATHEPTAPSRQETLASIASDEAVPDTDPNTVCAISYQGMKRRV